MEVMIFLLIYENMFYIKYAVLLGKKFYFVPRKNLTFFSRGYYITNSTVHTVVNVRNIKQYLIDGKCPTR